MILDSRRSIRSYSLNYTRLQKRTVDGYIASISVSSVPSARSMQRKLAWISHTVRRDCWLYATRSPSNGPQAEVWQARGLLTVLCTLLPQRRKPSHQGRLWCTPRQVYACQHENAIPWTVNCTEENWWFALTPVCKWRSSFAVNWTPNPPALQITAPQLWSSNNCSWDTKMQMRTSMATVKRLRPVWLAKSNDRRKKT